MTQNRGENAALVFGDMVATGSPHERGLVKWWEKRPDLGAVRSKKEVRERRAD